MREEERRVERGEVLGGHALDEPLERRRLLRRHRGERLLQLGAVRARGLERLREPGGALGTREGIRRRGERRLDDHQGQA